MKLSHSIFAPTLALHGLLLMNGCGGSNGSSCSVEKKNSEVTLLCTDGTTAKVTDGTNGADGTIGVDGDNGTNGTNGVNGNAGTDGANGLTSLVAASDELSGDNCKTGGQKLDFGLDSNENGTLDNAEITKTVYVCNGKSGSSLYELSGTPDYATVFDTIEQTYSFGNNLTNTIWHRESNTIITGDFDASGYWSFPAGTTGYSASPNEASSDNFPRLVLIPVTNTVVFTSTPASDGVGEGSAANVRVGTISITGALSAILPAQFSDSFTGACQLTSASSTLFLCFDGTVIRRYKTTMNSPLLTFVDTIALDTPLAASATCDPGAACYGSTFAWDGMYYYFAEDQGSDTNLLYHVYDASGAWLASPTASGAGSINGVYFDWSTARYSAHDGYGNRTGGLTYSSLAGDSDTHCFSAVSSAHTLL